MAIYTLYQKSSTFGECVWGAGQLLASSAPQSNTKQCELHVERAPVKLQHARVCARLRHR